MNVLTRDRLLQRPEVRYRNVEIPGLGTVRIRSITELERGRIEAHRALARGDEERERATREEPCRWVIATTVDAEGKRLFESKDLPELMQQDAAVTRAIYLAALEHCGILAVEDHEKNSAGTGGDSSPGE